jgi:hypothetical protein
VLHFVRVKPVFEKLHTKTQAFTIGVASSVANEVDPSNSRVPLFRNELHKATLSSEEASGIDIAFVVRDVNGIDVENQDTFAEVVSAGILQLLDHSKPYMCRG